MAERTLRQEFRARLESGSTEEALIKKMKSQGLSSEDYDLPLSVARQKGLQRLSETTGIPTPESLFPSIPTTPTPVVPEEPIGLAEPAAPTVAKAGEEGQAVKRVGGILAPAETAKMVAGTVSGLFGAPGAQAAREKAERAQPTIEVAKQSTLQNLERKRRRQKEMGLNTAEAFVVDAAEDAYELGTGLASILGTALAGVPVPEGMEAQMEPFKMGEQVGEAIVPGLIGGISAVIEDPAVAARAPISTLLNLYPAAKAVTKLGTAAVPKLGVVAQSTIPQLVNRTEGFLASKIPGVWRTFINAYETGSPEANVLWKQIRESATTIDNAFNEALPKIESAILGERRLPEPLPSMGRKAIEDVSPPPPALKSNETVDLIVRGKTFLADDSIPLVHRSQSPISIADIDVEIARAGRQSKKGKIKTAGFYAYEPDANIIAQKGIDEVERLDATFGKQKLEFEIPAGTKVLDISDQPGASARLSPDILQELRNEGYQAIKGKDVIGPPEYIVIDNAIFGSQPKPLISPTLKLVTQPSQMTRRFEPTATPPIVPGPRFGKAESQMPKKVDGTPVPSTVREVTIPEVTLPRSTVNKLQPALGNLENQLRDVATELSENLRRVYQVDTGVVADPIAVRSIANNAIVDALKNDTVGAIIKKPEYIEVVAKTIGRTREKLETDLRLNPFGALSDNELQLAIEALDTNPATSSWRVELNTPAARDQLVKASLQRVQEGLKNAVRESLLEKEALPFMEAITANDANFAEVVVDTATKRNLNPEIVRRNKYTNYITAALDEEGNSTLLNAINELRRRIDKGEPLPNFIPSTRSQQLLEDLKGALDRNNATDAKLLKYLDGMSPTPYTYAPTAQGLIAAPFVADAVGSTSSDLLRGADYLLSTLPKRTALPLNLKSAFNNYIGNETVMAMAYGNIPGTTLPYSFVKNLIKSRPGEFGDAPNNLRLFKDAGQRVGLFNTDQITKDVAVFERMQSGLAARGQENLEKVLGPLTKTFGLASSKADNMYKTYAGFKEFERGLKYLDKLNDGEFIQFATGQNTSQRITRVGDTYELQNFSLGKPVGKSKNITNLSGDFEAAPLTNEGYNAIARYAKTVADSYFFDYGDVPVLLQKIRAAPVVGVGSPFFTWSYKATDLPWKQGLASATIRGPDRILSNSRLVNALQGFDSAQVALRRAGLTALAKREQDTSPELNTVMSYNPKDPGSKMFKSLGDPSVYAAMNLGQADPFGQALEVANIATNIASWAYEKAAGQTTDQQLEAIYKNPKATTDEAFSAAAAKLRRDAIYKKETIPAALTLFGLGLTFFTDKYYEILKSQEQGNSFDYTKNLIDLYVPGMAKTTMAYVNDELKEGLMSSALQGYPVAESTAQYAIRSFLGPGYATVNTPEQYKRFRAGVQKEMEAVIKKKKQQIAIKRKEKAESVDIDTQEQTLELMQDLVNQSLEEMDSYFLGGEKPIVPGAE